MDILLVVLCDDGVERTNQNGVFKSHLTNQLSSRVMSQLTSSPANEPIQRV